MGKISALLNPVTYVIINVAIVAVIWVGGEQVDSGTITQGKVIALVNYMSQILVELIKMANLIILISKATACKEPGGQHFPGGDQREGTWKPRRGNLMKTEALEGNPRKRKPWKGDSRKRKPYKGRFL